MRRRRLLCLLVAPVIAVTGAATARAAAAPVEDTVTGDRASVRDVPGRLILANARGGDRVELQAYCGEWVRVRVDAGHAMATPVGWVLRSHLARASQPGGLDGVPPGCDRAADDDPRWQPYVSAINSPFRSLRYTGTGTPSNGETEALWRRVFFPTGVRLAASPDCVPAYNYVRDGAGDRVDPTQRMTGLDLSSVNYRYVTRSGAVALVSARRPGQSAGVWGFVPASCVQPREPGGTVYFPRVVQLDRFPEGRAVRTADLAGYGCSLGVRSASQPTWGWSPDPQDAPACRF